MSWVGVVIESEVRELNLRNGVHLRQSANNILTELLVEISTWLEVHGIHCRTMIFIRFCTEYH